MKHLQAIKAKLKAQHPGLPQAILDRVADTLAKTAKDEATDEELSQAVANHKDIVTSLAEYSQQEGDRRATAAQKAAEDKAKATPAPATPPNPASPAPETKPEEVPEWAKGLIQSVNAIVQKDVAKTHTESLQGLLKDKVPASFYAHALAGRQFKDQAEVEAYAETVKNQYTAFQTEMGIEKLAGQTPPAKGTPASGDQKEEEMTAAEKAYVESLKPKTA
jgi:hypothetical protein